MAETFVVNVAEAASRLRSPIQQTEAGTMSKKVFYGTPGESGVGDAVRAWLDRIGIDPAMVVGYSVFQHVGEVPRIVLEMYFDDAPAQRPGIPEKCPNPARCVDCPGRLTGDVANCTETDKGV